LDYWEIKHVLLLIFLLIVHHTNLEKVKFYLFLVIHLIIYSDVWGVAPVVSHAHYKYFVTFIDDFSCFTWVYFLRAKGEVFSVFKCFLALLETQFSARIKVLRSDSGGEYMSNEFHAFFQSKGIISQRSCPSTPQQNSVTERKNHHLLDVV
jgi:transposase InsO family protein